MVRSTWPETTDGKSARVEMISFAISQILGERIGGQHLIALPTSFVMAVSPSVTLSQSCVDKCIYIVSLSSESWISLLCVQNDEICLILCSFLIPHYIYTWAPRVHIKEVKDRYARKWNAVNVANTRTLKLYEASSII